MAAELLGALGLDDCVLDPRVVVMACGLRLLASTRAPACLVGSTIVYDPRVRPSRQAGTIAHELGHFALRRVGEADPERAATRVGAALSVPRRPLDARLRAYGWELPAVCEGFAHASHELVARRILELREGGLVIRDGRRERLVVSAWLPEGAEEELRAAARQAAETGLPTRAGEARAWNVAEPGFPRAIALYSCSS